MYANWVGVVNKFPYVALDLVHFSCAITGAIPPNIPFMCKAFAQTFFSILPSSLVCPSGHSVHDAGKTQRYIVTSFFRLVYGCEDLAVEWSDALRAYEEAIDWSLCTVEVLKWNPMKKQSETSRQHRTAHEWSDVADAPTLRWTNRAQDACDAKRS